MAAQAAAKARPKDYGRVQFPALLGLPLWAFERAVADGPGLVPCTGEYKGYPVYDGRALETFADRDALDRAMTSGRLLTRDQAARYLRIRPSDIGHLIDAHWLEPVTWVHSSWQRRRSAPQVPLLRAADLDVLLAHPAINWDAVRSTPAGRPSGCATQRVTKPGS
jgi:hypothetical protein